MLLEITIPTDKVARVKNAFDNIYNQSFDKAEFENIIKEWIIDKVRNYEHEQAVDAIIIEDVF